MKNLIVERDACALLDQTEDGAVASFCMNAAESTMYTISETGVVTCYSVGETLKVGYGCGARLGVALWGGGGPGGPAWRARTHSCVVRTMLPPHAPPMHHP